MDSKELRGLMEAYSEVYAPQQIDEISQKTATSAYAQRRTGEFEGDDASDRVAKTNKLKGRIEKKFGAKAGEHADRAADVKTFGRKDASGRRKQSPQPRIQTSDHENQREFKRELRIRRDRRLRAARGEDTNEQFDIFDVVLEFLQVEGYAETLEEAEWMMANMIDEEAIGIILGEGNPIGRFLSNRKHKLRDTEKGHEDIMRRNREYQTKGKGPGGYRNKGAGRVEKVREDYVNEAQAARENPEKYEREQAKKSAPVRGERTPMPPRGDKRREDFEKWYAANVR